MSPNTPPQSPATRTSTKPDETVESDIERLLEIESTLANLMRLNDLVVQQRKYPLTSPQQLNKNQKILSLLLLFLLIVALFVPSASSVFQLLQWFAVAATLFFILTLDSTINHLRNKSLNEQRLALVASLTMLRSTLPTESPFHARINSIIEQPIPKHLHLSPNPHPFLYAFPPLAYLDGVLRTIYITYVLAFTTLLLIPLLPLRILLQTFSPNTTPSIFGHYRKLIASTLLQIYSITVTLPPLPHQASLIFFTHKSTLDAFILNLIPSTTTLTKLEILLIPFFGILAYFSPAIFINRSDINSAISSIKKCETRITNKEIVCVSPEGTRSKSGHATLPLKKGAFHLVKNCPSTPVHLMIILGGYELWPSSSKFPVPGSLEVTFHEVKNLQPNDIKHNQQIIEIAMAKEACSTVQPNDDVTCYGHFLGSGLACAFYAVMKYVYVECKSTPDYTWVDFFALHLWVLGVHGITGVLLYGYEKLKREKK
ncbi:hypothetical protein TrVE_jg9735 [Triparma verrucosa]|uniref:Phospholipid/glycerol acyltransferase domain-containing protein n=1 Tax=Triparma verrucosa TaxID=1606542 RepID=A0A9W7F6E5_9STRA|nr:hypothetical protein TrVE_jg9735 [Triparma verrucosa]